MRGNAGFVLPAIAEIVPAGKTLVDVNVEIVNYRLRRIRCKAAVSGMIEASPMADRIEDKRKLG